MELNILTHPISLTRYILSQPSIELIFLLVIISYFIKNVISLKYRISRISGSDQSCASDSLNSASNIRLLGAICLSISAARTMIGIAYLSSSFTFIDGHELASLTFYITCLSYQCIFLGFGFIVYGSALLMEFLTVIIIKRKIIAVSASGYPPPTP